MSAQTHSTYDVAIVGGGAAGIATSASLLSRDPSLDIAIIDPANTHYYQPGWTMVGGGIFQQKSTARSLRSLVSEKVTRIQATVKGFNPKDDCVVLEDKTKVHYKRLVVCPGLKLDWDRVEGLSDTLGRNGVTSNYRYDLAPYTWELVQNLKSGRAIFTQPPMPIKCAGAPQKALYLSADHWHRSKTLDSINIEFHNAGGVLFGVADYVPALMKYIDKYQADLNFFSNLVGIDGSTQKAYFDVAKPDEDVKRIEVEFDMIHVCPPQTAPDFIKASALSDAAGWVDVDQQSLRHKSFENIWSLGDVMNAPNAKTAAAARKQAPIVAANMIADMDNRSAPAAYDGYGSCPLTVEKGKIVLAEFGYGGKLLPTFPKALLNGTKPTRTAWFLKASLLPAIYWNAMLRGKEWLARP
ncbi:NAD(P)/FAD-dependent oxidoreductase [Amylibacter sp. SFDW26]|nr:NAD(P)/FAD-dependent oxidoreductase [Amylibacter sp. SFDW26]